uniref:Uncharacterized protein n=1 Tax=Anguilla anguilla TaxID=7936 RepID=A0A0E9QJ51_ANGAN
MLELLGGIFSPLEGGFCPFSIFKLACSFYCFSSMPTNHEL